MTTIPPRNRHAAPALGAQSRLYRASPARAYPSAAVLPLLSSQARLTFR
jgi:hypothetical protein